MKNNHTQILKRTDHSTLKQRAFKLTVLHRHAMLIKAFTFHALHNAGIGLQATLAKVIQVVDHVVVGLKKK
jgi:hypothetical protein